MRRSSPYATRDTVENPAPESARSADRESHIGLYLWGNGKAGFDAPRGIGARGMSTRRFELKRRADPSAPLSVRAEVAKFALAGLAAVILIGAVGVVITRRAATSEALREAKEFTRLAGRGIAQPLMTGGVLRGDRVALARLDAAVRHRILGDPVVRVKIWDATGRIVYSDEPRLIGSRYKLGDDELDALRRGGVYADASDLTRPENRFERKYSRLVEVYSPIRATDGTRLLYEDYERSSSITASSRRQWAALAPGLLGALLVLELVQVPLAWSLARRLRDRQREREALLRQAMESSDLERRRIAADLHDGVVQRLAGVSYSLAAAADRTNGHEPAVSDTLERAASETRATIRELRTMLVDIYPPTLRRSGFKAALSDLVAPLQSQGVDVALNVPEPLDVPDEVEALLFRGSQEALRNVSRHAHARHVAVDVSRHNGSVQLVVTDDGHGFDPGHREDNGDRRGHFGLRLMRDLAFHSHGTLEIESAPGQGTRVKLEVPLP